MQEQRTITINGRRYDAQTGLVVDDGSAESAETVIAPAEVRSIAHQNIHAPVLQRSQTLHRRSSAKPEAAKVSAEPAKTTEAVAPQAAIKPLVRRTPSRIRPDIRPRNSAQTMSPTTPLTRKQAPVLAPVTSQTTQKPAASVARPQHHAKDIPAQPHPAVQKAHAQQLQKPVPNRTHAAPKPAATIKNEAIESALSKAVVNQKQHKQPKKRLFSRLASVGASALALILLGGYFTYINMPNLSVRVAAAQAGFDASYPDYHPDGYRLNGPIAAENGKVTMKFASNSGPQNFSIAQEKSNWDSMAVQEYVSETSNNNAITTAVDGLTIYIYGSNAAWVNGGVLYTVDGDAPLSGEQIRRIATSM